MLVIERIAKHPLRAWTVVILSAVAAAWLAGAGYRGKLEQDRLALLNIDVQRDAIAAMSLTLDSNLMGAISLLGLIEPDIKNESAEAIRSSQPKISALLESIARSQQIQGLFVVGKDGFVKSSWDDSGKPSTGIDVRFRPYYQQAMAGRNNIYAAVSLARGDHALYFAAPVYAAMARSGDPVGVVVARTDMEKLERLLARSGQAAMLLSPQGVVFASSRHEWRGMLAGPVTPARVAEIRAVRQFGKLFEEQEPRPLPVSIAPGLVQGEGRQYAVASAAVDWHDPSGAWQLVVLEDLGQSVPPGSGRAGRRHGCGRGGPAGGGITARRAQPGGPAARPPRTRTRGARTGLARRTQDAAGPGGAADAAGARAPCPPEHLPRAMPSTVRRHAGRHLRSRWRWTGAGRQLCQHGAAAAPGTG
ncbi:cache domain-containing protein [Massilia eburnea]|uniref:cache domain-containing protein n=1 Tax=Massilia eburnea TaxID=1776165 RepID=UPI003D6BD9A7